MISGAHVVVYTTDAAADRAFFRDVLGFPSVDVGDGWLIFKLPPAEAAFHPADENGTHELFLICDDLVATMAELRGKGITVEEPKQAGWGSVTRVKLPGGGWLSLYQPRHARP